MSLATRALKNQHYHPPIWILSLVTTQFRLLKLCSSGGIEDTVTWNGGTGFVYPGLNTSLRRLQKTRGIGSGTAEPVFGEAT